MGPPPAMLGFILARLRHLSVTESAARCRPARKHHLAEYRAYLIGSDGHIQGYEPLICPDDDAAIAAAKRLVDSHDVELWEGTRKVILLPAGRTSGD